MAENKTGRLLEEFPPIPTEKWEEAIRKDLKITDNHKKLIWETIEEIDIKPYYRQEDLDGLQYLVSQPNVFPYIQGAKSNLNKWEICQDIHVRNVGQANRDARFALNRGATAIAFHLPSEAINNEKDLSSLVSDIPVEEVRLDFYAGSDFSELIKYIAAVYKSRKIPEGLAKGLIGYDPIGHYTLTGNFNPSLPEAIKTARDLINFARTYLPKYRVLVLNGSHFKNAGSTIVQELGYTLSIGAEYLTQLTDLNLLVDSVTPRIQFIFAVGSNYFMEIAKIRAARFLWSKIVEAYKPDTSQAYDSFIHTVTSDWNKTAYDPYVNLLRTTSEAMSAALGGTDSLTIQPFDSIFNKPSPFSERLARNIQIILKEEAYFDKVIDPAAGSYYIENLTDSLIDKAWKLFQRIESKGGFLKAFRNGIIQAEIEENARNRFMNIGLRKKNFVGTNLYPNLSEEISGNIVPSVYSPEQSEIPDTETKTLKLYRAVEPFEQLRLKTERFQGKKPVVFLFTIGDLAIRKARANFASNFFGCAGFEIIEGSGHPDINTGIKECLKHNPDIVVICSSDKEYEKYVPELYLKFNTKSIVVVSGYPEGLVNEFREMGIRHFIHMKSNVLESLMEFQKELGIDEDQ